MTMSTASKASETSYDVIDLNHDQLSAELKDSFESRVPLYIWGPPGIGKSYVCAQVAKDRAAMKNKFFIDWNRTARPIKHALYDGVIPVEYVSLLAKDNPALAKKAVEAKKPIGIGDCFIFADYRLSQRDPSDINGLPALSGNFVEWKPNLMFSVMSLTDADGMIFFDEIPQAMPVVQNAAYQLIQDRCCGEIAFSDNIIVVAAGNRLTDGGNQFQIPPALANRFTHAELSVPSPQRWTDWAIDADVDSRIIAFLRWKPSYLMDDMGEVRKRRAMAWCSPRSWEKASDKIKGISGAGKVAFDRIYGKVATAVGKARAIEFKGFIKTTVSLDLKDILAHPEKAQKFDMDIKWALISAVAEYYRVDKKYLDAILVLCDNLSPDFSVSMLRMMRRYDRTQFATRLAKCTNKKIALGYMKYFED
jgi:MoxR-like ATPase